MRSLVIALGRSVALLGVAAATAVLFALTMAAFVPGFGLGLVFLVPPAIVGYRRFTTSVRRLSGRWSGVEIPLPYKPPPTPPVRRPDGLYERDNRLYKRAWWPRMSARIDWMMSDRATGRDLLFLALHPVVGTVIAGLPAATLGATIWVAVSSGWVAWLPGLLFVASCAAAPWLVELYGRWCRVLLGPVSAHGLRRIEARKRWLGERFVALAKLLALGGLGLVAFVAGLAEFVAAVVRFIGWFVFFVPAVNQMRRIADVRRQLAGMWSGVTIESPYRAERPLVREPDGRYRVGKALFKTEHWARWYERQDRIPRESATWRDLAWALAEPITGVVLALGAAATVVVAWVWLFIPTIVVWAGGSASPLFGGGWGSLGHVLAILVGLVAMAAAFASTPVLLRWHGHWTAVLLAPTRAAALARRVERLTETRRDVIADQAAEVRRIERDLHDGAQARLVAVGLALGAAENLVLTDPEAAKRLVAQAREASATALVELRDLVRGILPPVLAERGLGDAVRALALDTHVPVDVTVDLPGRPSDPVESAAYFAVSEALANAVKHAGASRIAIDLRWCDGTLRMSVSDDGRGGADPRLGSGLAGLSRRIEAFDGTVTLTSPPGGPTVVAMELPCVLSSPKTSLS